MAVAACRPQVVCAYPITPQTHIVEGVGEMVKSGELAGCEFINVESEFAAMSVAIGASAAGSRAYTATSSQGLLFMIEAVYNAGGLGLPVVMTLANRAIGAPINIWNDHSDAMAVRDAGWVMLFAESNQEATDLHIQAFRLAEDLSLPVMVNMDGFVLTHATERIDVPTQEQVDAFLPPFEPRQVLDPADPVTIGALVGPEAFTEVRFLAHAKQLQAIGRIREVADEFAQAFGRRSGGLVNSYRVEDADVVVVALGSILGTIKDVADEMRERGTKVGVVGITSFRPFPLEALHEAIGDARRVVIIERAFSIGFGGVLSTDVALAIADAKARISTVVAGLGGRAVPEASIAAVIEDAMADSLEALRFVDLDRSVVERELARMAGDRRSGPSAENVLRDLRAVASGSV
jgi:pyruvate ferredoxin oxidoreductase alpha subunit